jgi:hypothetical protein
MIMETIGGSVERSRLQTSRDATTRSGGLVRSASPAVIEKRRESLQEAHDTAARRRSEECFVFCLAAFPAVIGWVLQPQGGWALALGAYTIFAILVTCMSIGFGVAELRRIGQRVMVMGAEGNDLTGLIPALDALYDALRSPSAGRGRMLAAYEAVVDRMQELVPGHPLSRLVARGYRPSEATDEYDRKLNFDKDPDERHWERAMKATDALRTLLASDGWILEKDVLKRVSDLVAPLRAVLRARDVPTWRIEYDAPPVSLERNASAVPDADSSTAPVIDAIAPPARVDAPSVTEDAVTAIEDRLNATGAMTLASLRPLTTAFRSADPNLFLGDDRATGESMIESHLPRLVDAFVVADDASVGPERDAVRADFARSLGFLRDSMAGIMDRHAQAARENLHVQARFVETRHGREVPFS